MSLCASATMRWLTQLWVADALRLQAQAFRDISTLPSRGCICNTVAKENILRDGSYFVISPVNSALKFNRVCSLPPSLYGYRLGQLHHYNISSICNYIVAHFTLSDISIDKITLCSA